MYINDNFFCYYSTKAFRCREVPTINISIEPHNIICRFKCATFGQQFEHENGSFYDHLSVRCKADQSWSAATIPHQCVCECLNVLQSWVISSSLSGSKCVKPPKPDDSRKMVVSWNPDFPPAHNEQITFKCNAGPPYNRCKYSNLLKLAQCMSAGNCFQSNKVSYPHKMSAVKF